MPQMFCIRPSIYDGAPRVRYIDTSLTWKFACLIYIARSKSWGLLYHKIRMVLLRSEISSGMCAKLRTEAASNNRDHASQSLLLLLAHATHIYFFILRAHPIRGESHNQRNATGEVATTSPPFYEPHRRSLCEGWTGHDLHILVTAPVCCDRKSRAACAQSYAPWQQATIEIMRRNLLLLLARATHIYRYSSRTSRSWWITQSKQRHRRGCNSGKGKSLVHRIPLKTSVESGHPCSTAHTSN